MTAMALMWYALLPCDKIGTVVREKLHSGAMRMKVQYDMRDGVIWIVA